MAFSFWLLNMAHFQGSIRPESDRRGTMQRQLRACQLLDRTGVPTADMLVNLLKSCDLYVS